VSQNCTAVVIGLVGEQLVLALHANLSLAQLPPNHSVFVLW